MLPACSTQLVSGRITATGRLPSAGLRSVPIGWLPGGPACPISYMCLSAACDLVVLSWSPPGGLSVLAGLFHIHSGRFTSANSHHSYIRSYWVSLPQLMSLRSASPVCATGRIVSNGSRSVAMGCCPADSYVLSSDRSIAVDVRSVPLDGVAAGSSELVIWHFRGICIQSAHLSDQLASAGCSPVSFDRFPVGHSRLIF